jgi:di/tricarboxylate transporter
MEVLAPLTLQGWLAAGATVLALGVMLLTTFSPEIVLLCALIFCIAIGAIDAEEAFSGAGSSTVLTVAALFIVATGVRRSGVLSYLLRKLLSSKTHNSKSMLKLLLPLSGFSAFLNNTPLVAILLPEVLEWCKRIKISPSKVLIPLSYATILGGTCTLMGTSTNLLVAGLVQKSGLFELHFFDLFPIALPVTIVGLTYLIIVSKWIPNRGGSHFESASEFTCELIVPVGSHLIGEALGNVKIDNKTGINPAEIIRDNNVLPAPQSTEKIKEGDRFVFAGPAYSMLQFHKIDGMITASDRLFDTENDENHFQRRFLVELVLAPDNPLVGVKIGRGGFRKRYGGAVLALSRGGQRVKSSDPVAWVFKSGDKLLIEAEPSFLDKYADSNEFYLLSRKEQEQFHWKPFSVGLFTLTALITTVITGVFTMLEAALFASAILVLTRILRGSEVRTSLDIRVLLGLIASFGMGECLRTQGVADHIAHAMSTFSVGTPLLALALIYICTNILTELISNVAAAAICLPIAISLATQQDLSPIPFVITLMIAASASFSTPVGYQTNLMVYGPGNYKFSDFMKIGIPLNIIVAILTLILAPLFYPF